MNAEQFAKEWGNYRFNLPQEAMPNAMAVKYDGSSPRFKLIGYVTNSNEKVAFELDAENSQYGWPAFGVTITIDRDELIVPNFPMVMSVNYKLLKTPRSYRISPEEMKKREVDALKLAEASKASPYPHICKDCSAPARRSCGQILCSNPSCKSRGKFLKSINYKPIKRGKVVPVHCPICLAKGIKSPAIYNSLLDDVLDTYYFECENGHDFTLHLSLLANNSIVYATQFGYDTDRLWNGKTWENI